MADPVFSALISGGKEAQAALTAMDKAVDLATAVATNKVGAVARASIRGGMRGRPRWDRRGKGRTGPEVNLNMTPHVVRKGGGPGKLTGQLYRNVRKSRKSRKELDGWSTAVFMGAKSAPGVNVYKGLIESDFPYFAPGIKKAVPKMPIVWEKAWAKATKT